MSVVSAKAFHPMRGHVEHGNKVVFADGRSLELRSVNGGWALFDKSGEQVGRKADGAYDLTALVVSLETEGERQ